MSLVPVQDLRHPLAAYYREWERRNLSSVPGSCDALLVLESLRMVLQDDYEIERARKDGGCHL